MAKSAFRKISRHIFSIILLIVAAALILLGTQLVLAGGSPYYLVVGGTALVCAWFLRTGDTKGAKLYSLMLAGTALWALWESGLDGWALMPRIFAPAVLGLWLLVPWSYDRPAKGTERLPAQWAVRGAILLCFGLIAIASIPFSSRIAAAGAPAPLTRAEGATNWPSWGNDQAGTRFANVAQLTPANVAELRPAWQYRYGADSNSSFYANFEVSPLKIGEYLYLCTPGNDMVSLDAETGRQLWRYRARTNTNGLGVQACRGVAFYRDPAAAPGSSCAERVMTATVDGRLIAVDAKRGVPCDGFGVQGQVDLKQGLGLVEDGYYSVTSAPQIVQGKVVLGGSIMDNQHIKEPSGVIRAFDAITGRFAWAFDVGRPNDHGLPKPGKTFTVGTPNSWAPISADETLGLVYLPTGNATPDFFGGNRRPFDETYSSSVIALDAQTGAVRWSFQTTHHDLWDYDVASQPALYDLPVGSRRIPVLIQPTKRGEIFVLDRRTGKPVLKVEERTVPKSMVPGERASPTQPFSPEMPSLAGPEPTEARMWGITPIDQAWCRLQFHQSRYDGTMTPPGLDRPSINHPGYMGGVNWGSVTIDHMRDIMVVNTNQMSVRAQLIPRAVADKEGIKPAGRSGGQGHAGRFAQAGTPYALSLRPFFSPLGIPCEQPPFGMISAVDLKARRILWSRPLGTTANNGPLGIATRLPLGMGVPTFGGPITTSGGLTFIAASVDGYIRAFETATGKLLWRAKMPAGGLATPISYISARSGRQFLVVAAGGGKAYGAGTGDYLIAYAIPRDKSR